MKKLVLLFASLSFVLNAQINVTTITDSIKGSGSLSLDSQGNLYIADLGDFLAPPTPTSDTTSVYKLDKLGNITVVATGFKTASGNAFDSQGNFYQADLVESKIYKIDINGQKTLFADSGLARPIGLVFDNNDNLYACNCGSSSISKIDTQGAVSSFASGPLFSCPNGIAIDGKGHFYVSNYSGSLNNIVKISPEGAPSVFATLPGDELSHLDYFAPDSILFACSQSQNAIFMIDHNGNIVDSIGSFQRGNVDGTQYVASFSKPNGIAITPLGDSIYVNTAVPLTNSPNIPLNPSLIRLITGIKGLNLFKRGVQEELSIYPNPVSERLFIDLHKLSNCSNAVLSIYSYEGKMVWTADGLCDYLDGNTLSIKTAGLKTGLYVLELEIDGRKVNSTFIQN